MTLSEATHIEKSSVAKSEKKQFTPAEEQGCSIEAMMNGDECEACR